MNCTKNIFFSVFLVVFNVVLAISCSFKEGDA